MSWFSRDKGEGSVNEKDILNALRQVQDPDLHKDLVSLGMIKDVKVEGGDVSFTVELTTPACPMKSKIENDCREAVSQVSGVNNIHIHMSAKTKEAEAAQSIPGIKNIFAVSSGKGGVGKSTVAVNLALALVQSGAKVGLMDADAYGPNVPIMLGQTDQPEIRNEKIIPPEIGGVKMMSVGLIAPGDTPVVWRGPMLHSLIQQFLHDIVWGELDYLVVDMPPGTGDAQLSLSKLAPLSGAVMVTTPQMVAQADVKRAIMMFRKVEVPVLGIVENMSYFLCPDNNVRYNIFGAGGGEAISQQYEIPLLGQLPIDPRIATSSDKGKPIVLEDSESPLTAEFMKMAQGIAQQISIANMKSPLPVVQ